MPQTATLQPNLHMALPVQINTSLTWVEILKLIQNNSQTVEVKIAPPGNTITSFGQKTLQLLESNSLLSL